MPTDDRIRLVALFGGRSAEHDISCITARHVLAAADPDRYDIEAIGIGRDGRWFRVDALAETLAAAPKALTANGLEVDPLPILADTSSLTTVVLPLLHGPLGEDGTVQGLLELADIAYVGAGVLASALCMDKVKTKEMLTVHGIPQARYSSAHRDEASASWRQECIHQLGLPLFVKPANMGSSVGVSKADTAEELAEAVELAATYDEWLVVEETISGREIECAVLGNLHPRASVPGEIIPGADFYDYADKYLDGASTSRIPADLEPATTEALQAMAIKAYRALRVEGLARVDFFFAEGDRGLLVNELNTMPGFTPISMYPKLWEASGLPYSELIDALVDLALERHARRPRRTDL